MMNILIADFDRKFVEELQRNWSVAGTNLLVCSDDKTLMPLIKKTSIDLAFIEVPFLMLDNMDLISYLKERQPGIEIFVLCDDRNWQGAASAITRGASSFLKKPVTLSLLESTTSKIQAQQQNKSNTQLMESQVLDKQDPGSATKQVQHAAHGIPGVGQPSRRHARDAQDFKDRL